MELFRNWNSIWLLHLCKEKNGNYIPIKKIKKIPYSRSQCVSLYLFAAFSLMFCKEQNPKLSSWFSRKGWEEHHISFLFLSIFHWNTFVHAKIFVSAFCHSLFVVRFFFSWLFYWHCWPMKIYAVFFWILCNMYSHIHSKWSRK